jgi:methylmalonyl-CoA/ethylmalonyl-CoA epimerase
LGINGEMNMLDRLSHVSIVVPDLEAAAARLAQVYGLAMGETMVNRDEGVRMAYIDLANARIEVMQPLAPDTPLGRFLQKNPTGGLHHISFAVDSVAAVAAALRKNGVQTIGKPGAKNVHGEPIAFIHPRDFIGALVELEEKT